MHEMPLRSVATSFFFLPRNAPDSFMGVSAISDAASAFPAATITGKAQSAVTAAPIRAVLHEIGKRIGPLLKNLSFGISSNI
jgi:hypothetical protein